MSGSRQLEVLVITAAAPVVGSLIAPGDAYLLRAPFPWLVLAPLLVALQHGLWAGLASAALQTGGALWYVMSLEAVPAATFASWSVGCMLVAIIAGQLRDSARARSHNLEQRSEELQDRLERSERTRHLIQLSHAKLAERVAATRSSLVSAIEGAQRRMSEARSMHELGQVLLEVLASQGNLHAASAYICGRDSGLLVTQPVASFGGNGPGSARHPLVVRAFETAKLAAIVDAGDPSPRDRSVLVAVPLITSARRVVGVVAVHQMPFMSFQAEHLQQLFVLAGHLADMLFDRWSALHEVPVAVVPAEPVSPQPVKAPVIAHAPTQRTWRGMPAVRVVEALPADAGENAPVQQPMSEPAEELVMNSAALQTSTVEVEVEIAVEQFDESAAETADLPDVASAQGTSSDDHPDVSQVQNADEPVALAAPGTGVEVPSEEPVVTAPADEPVVTAPAEVPVVAAPADEPVVTAPADEPVVAAAPAEEPVSATVPILAANRPRNTPPPPDPNRIAALIRGAVRVHVARAPVKGVALGKVKTVPAGNALRERVRAVAQTRSGSSR